MADNIAAAQLACYAVKFVDLIGKGKKVKKKMIGMEMGEKKECGGVVAAAESTIP